jgi:hypothetical protein
VLELFFDLLLAAHNPKIDRFLLNVFLHPLGKGKPLLVRHATPPPGKFTPRASTKPVPEKMHKILNKQFQGVI